MIKLIMLWLNFEKSIATVGLASPPNNPAGEGWQEILIMLHKLLAAAQQERWAAANPDSGSLKKYCW